MVPVGTTVATVAAYPTSVEIGFRTPYDVAPRHFEVMFTYTSREDVTQGYVCAAGLQPFPLNPDYISGVDYVTSCPNVADQMPTKDDSLGVKGIKPVFNTPYTMRWCLSAADCGRSTNTYCGATKADGLCQNDRMSICKSTFTIRHFTIRILHISDLLRNSVM
eukprot:SAG31_NODE_1569_length_7855_cov_13.073234_6_plen_163_part_00